MKTFWTYLTALAAALCTVAFVLDVITEHWIAALTNAIFAIANYYFLYKRLSANELKMG